VIRWLYGGRFWLAASEEERKPAAAEQPTSRRAIARRLRPIPTTLAGDARET
jgi:hypothetical protein